MGAVAPKTNYELPLTACLVLMAIPNLCISYRPKLASNPFGPRSCGRPLESGACIHPCTG